MKQQRVKRLALSYLAVIMTLSLAFSVIIYACLLYTSDAADE